MADETDRWKQISAIVDAWLDEDEQVPSFERSALEDELRQRVVEYLRRSSLEGVHNRQLVSRVGELLEAALQPSAQERLKIGETVGVYRIEAVVGEGGMGTVFAARRDDGNFDQDVALKLLHRGLADPMARQRFLQERQILAGLRHPNIARLLDGGVIHGLPYLVMERVDGQPITEYTAARHFGREECVGLMLQACDAIQHAHRQGVIHRDLKPSNLLVEEGAKGEAKLVVLDFGIALVEDAQQRVTSTGQIFGTPGYMSAEQVTGSEVDRRSDVFSLGVVLYEILSGERPFGDGDTLDILQRIVQGESKPLKQWLPDLSDDLATIVETCIAREPTKRYDSVRALAEDLESYLDGRPIAARPIHGLERWRRRARRHPRIAALTLGAVTVTLTSLLLLLLMALNYTHDLAVERNAAIEARRDAEELLDFMLEDLYQGLDRIGRLDLLDQVAVQALDYFARRPAGGSDSEIRGRAAALHHAGQILEVEGELEQALAAYAENVHFFDRLAQQEPRPIWQLELAHGHRAMASALAADADFEQALGHIDRTLEICEELGELDAVPEGWGEVETPEHALALLDEATRFASEQAALAGAPGSSTAAEPATAWHHRQSMALSFTGLVFHQEGQFEEALVHFHSARDLSEHLVELDPANSLWRGELQLIFGRIGQVWLDLEDPEKAIVALEAAREQSEILLDIEPENSHWNRELSVAHSTLAAARRQMGDLQAALGDLEKSLAISRTRFQRLPNHHSTANDLAWDLLDYGRIQRELGQQDAGNSAMHEAVDVIRKVRSKVPESAYYLDTEVQILLELGRLEEARPLVGQLHEMGWQAPDFLELVAEHGLSAEVFPDRD